MILRRYTSIAFLDKLKAYMLDSNDDNYPDIRVKGFEDLLKCRCEKAFRLNSDLVPRAIFNGVRAGSLEGSLIKITAKTGPFIRDHKKVSLHGLSESCPVQLR